MNKKLLFGLLLVNVLLLFVSCANMADSVGNPDMGFNFYDYKPYINGALVTINKDKVKNATSFVLYYGNNEIAEFEDSIFIPSDPNRGGNNIEGYLICSKNGTKLSDKRNLYIKSSSYSYNKDYDIVLTQKSETYDSITFEWDLNLPDDLAFYDLENSETKCLIGNSGSIAELNELKGEDIGNKQIIFPKRAPAKTYSSYGYLIYSYTDLLGIRHNDVVTNLISQNAYKAHTKALDKIENISVSTKRTTADFSFTELTDEQLHGLTDSDYMVRVTNKTDSEEKPFTKSLSKDKTTGKFSISGLKADTNYQFELFAAQNSDFADFANMATVEAKTTEPLAALKMPTITASDSYDVDFKTSFTVEFEKHPYDTAEHPMEYQVEYFLFSSWTPNKAAVEYFSYPADGKVTVSNINTGNTYKVVLKARDVSDTENVLSTEVQKVKTKQGNPLSSISLSQYTSAGRNYNWGAMTGDDIKSQRYFKVDVSSLYDYSSPKFLIINSTAGKTFTFNNKLTKMGHFDLYAYVPNWKRASTSSLNVISLSSFITGNTAEYNAYMWGNYIRDSYVYDDCIYFVPELQYSIYDNELTDEYNICITFVKEPSLR